MVQSDTISSVFIIYKSNTDWAGTGIWKRDVSCKLLPHQLCWHRTSFCVKGWDSLWALSSSFTLAPSQMTSLAAALSIHTSCLGKLNISCSLWTLAPSEHALIDCTSDRPSCSCNLWGYHALAYKRRGNVCFLLPFPPFSPCMLTRGLNGALGMF